MLKQIGIVAFGLVVVATSSSAFAQQAQRPLTRGIAVHSAPVAPKPAPATRASAVEEKIAGAPAAPAEITAEAKPEAPVVAEEAKPVDAAPPVVVEKAPVEPKAPVI